MFYRKKDWPGSLVVPKTGFPLLQDGFFLSCKSCVYIKIQAFALAVMPCQPLHFNSPLC